MVWACAPRVNGDPVFCALLDGDDLADTATLGLWAVEFEGSVVIRQAYLRNTPILRTEFHTAEGPAVEVLDFCPRYRQLGRQYRPMAFTRTLRPLAGVLRIRIRLRSMMNYGERPTDQTAVSNHIRYVDRQATLRRTTDCPVSHIQEERTFRL